MRHLASKLVLAGTLAGTTALPMALTLVPQMVWAQAQELSYRFYDQRIPLTLRKDHLAVAFQPQAGGTRGGSTEPPYLRLQKELQQPITGTRGGQTALPDVSVKPLGQQYAVIELPQVRSQSVEAILKQRLQQSYVAAQLPVLQREGGEEPILLPNEMVVSFEPDASDAQIEQQMKRYGLEVIRPLRFSQNRFLVKSKRGGGLRILNLASQLSGMTGIQSATPNFVQQAPYRVAKLDWQMALAAEADAAEADPKAITKTQDSLLWHLDSKSQGLVQRPDVRAKEAWAQGAKGEDVVVAVLDSLVQWDHPDLKDNLHRIGDEVEDRYPGEVHGWDFSNSGWTCSETELGVCNQGDPDTRISEAELELLQPAFRDTFILSDEELLTEYVGLAEAIQYWDPTLAPEQVAGIIRSEIRQGIAGEFHGTWSAGVIAANSAEPGSGAMGVAPEAKIMPVRVFGMNGQITSAALIEAIGYAAKRGADVINMSLGGLLPDEGLTDQLFSVLDEYPDLVVVASAGNESLDGVGFPAAIPGVLSVWATNVRGQRTFYSSYGASLDVVAPGGDTSWGKEGGIFTTGGTWVPGFWEGVEQPLRAWGPTFDPLGKYVQVQGTSFSAPAVSGVVALMRGVAAGRRLSRETLLEVLRSTASYEELRMTRADANRYRLQAEVGFGTVVDLPFARPSGINRRGEVISREEYFFGVGLVNAAKAIEGLEN